jgi:ubiquitin thioesterase protein OTUB1
MMSADGSNDAKTAPSSIEESVRLSEARMKEIEEEVQKAPLTSEIRPLSDLEAQYKDVSFLAGLKALQEDYGQIRTVRGDGNCYYRAFLYSLAEMLFPEKSNKQEAQRILEFVKKTSWENVKTAGYEEMTIEVFFDELVSLLERVIAGSIDAAALHTEMNEENTTSDYCTWYLRVVTATHLKMDPDRFIPFLEQHVDMAQFCQREVEPMGKECEQLQVLALAEAFGLQVQIEYLDGHDLVGGKVANHIFGPENAAKLFFLYRPGHYDILYPK